MKGLSFNEKGGRIYARFRKKGYQDKHLSCDLDTAIRTLRVIFQNRNYIHDGVFSEHDLTEMENEIRERLGRGNKI